MFAVFIASLFRIDCLHYLTPGPLLRRDCSNVGSPGQFLGDCLETNEKGKLGELKDKALLSCRTRPIRKVRKSGTISAKARAVVDRCLKDIERFTDRLDALEF